MRPDTNRTLTDNEIYPLGCTILVARSAKLKTSAAIVPAIEPARRMIASPCLINGGSNLRPATDGGRLLEICDGVSYASPAVASRIARASSPDRQRAEEVDEYCPLGSVGKKMAGPEADHFNSGGGI